MKNIIMALVVLLLVSGCAPKMDKIHFMPEKKTESTAEISIIRNYNILGSAIRGYPTVNGQKIAGLYTKDYVHFNLEEGKYKFGLMFPDVLLGVWIKENTIEKYIQAKKQYYFLITPTFIGMEIEEISYKDGEERISSSSLINTGNLSHEPDPVVKIIKPLTDTIGLDEDDKRQVE